jgi:hypothetical protein
MSLASKKRRRIARTAAVARGELKRAHLSISFYVVKKHRYIPSWLNACIKDGVAPRWSPRLKRHGGMMMIEAMRELQFERIEALFVELRAAELAKAVVEKQQLLASWRTWLTENKRRVLSSDIEEFFWPSVVDAVYEEEDIDHKEGRI